MLKDIKTIKKDLLDKFREIDAEKDDSLPENWLIEEYLPDLNSFERKNFDQAIKELTSQGLITNVKRPTLNLKLTEKGANLIN
jgi:Asp-tRNA(Asn)/Glu-tRNA(Gln) amidotransferase B subunit